MGAGSLRPPTEASITLSAQRGLGRPLRRGRARQGPGGDPQADASLAAAFRGRGKGQELPPPGHWAAEPTARPSQGVPSSQGSLCARSFRSHLSKAGASGIICQSWPAPDAGDRPGQCYSGRRPPSLSAGLKSEPRRPPTLSQAQTEPRRTAFPEAQGCPGESGIMGSPGRALEPGQQPESRHPPTPSGNGATGAPGMRGAAHRDSGAQAPGPPSEARPPWAGVAMAVPGSNGGSTRPALCPDPKAKPTDTARNRPALPETPPERPRPRPPTARLLRCSCLEPRAPPQRAGRALLQRKCTNGRQALGKVQTKAGRFTPAWMTRGESRQLGTWGRRETLSGAR